MTAHHNYDMTLPSGPIRRLTVGWLLLGLGSMTMGGILPLLIVLSRTPGVQEHIPFGDFFKTAIVIHVDLTVLVWFLALAGVLWTLNTKEKLTGIAWAALWLSVLGTVIFAFSPFIMMGEPLMNNYVPVIQSEYFLFGLGLFGAGFSLMVLHHLLCSQSTGGMGNGDSALHFGLYTALIIGLFALIALVASYLLLPDHYTGREYFELLFWGGGHILQFNHTQLMVVCWIWLASISGGIIKMSPRTTVIILALGFSPVLLTPLIYLNYEVYSASFSTAMTQLMIYGGGIAALPIGLIVIWGMIKGTTPKELRPEQQALLYSVILFGVGGIIGFLITGINVTIPAHYHGSDVGVTLAFMGITYHLLPRLGYQRPSLKLATIQPLIYGGGQLLHIMGLAWSGGNYNVPRKTAGAAQGLDTIQETIAMGVMGVGGVISIIGGVLFLVIVFMAMFRHKPEPPPVTDKS